MASHAHVESHVCRIPVEALVLTISCLEYRDDCVGECVSSIAFIPSMLRANECSSAVTGFGKPCKARPRWDIHTVASLAATGLRDGSVCYNCTQNDMLDKVIRYEDAWIMMWWSDLTVMSLRPGELLWLPSNPVIVVWRSTEGTCAHVFS